MGNIELTILAAVTSGDACRRGELSYSKAKDEGGFAEVLAEQQEGLDVDKKNGKIPTEKQKPKQTDKPDSEERNRISAEDSDDPDVETKGDNLFQEVPSQETPTAETPLGKEITLGKEIPVDGKVFQVVEGAGKEAENFEQQPGFSDCLLKNHDLSQQNDLLMGIHGDDGEVQVSSVGDWVAGKDSGVESAAQVDNYILGNSEPVQVDENLTVINPGSNKKAAGSLAGDEATLMQKSEGLTIPSDEAVSVSPAEAEGLRLQSVEPVEFASSNEFEDKLVQVDNEPITPKDNSEAAIAAAVSVDQKSEVESSRQIKDVHGSLFDGPPFRGNISQNGRVVAEIPEEVQIQINNEFAPVKVKSENMVFRSGQRSRDAALTGDETGVAHLQGRARENQSALAPNDQLHLKELTEFEADAGDTEEFSFSGISKEIFKDQVTLSSSLESVIKEKHSSDHTILKSDEMAAVHLDAGKDSLVKNSSNIISTKPLPVSDENLIEQIQSGLVRQIKGRQTVTIRLWPESMGKVDVKLVLRDQQMSATFMVEQSHVKDAMLRKINSLRDGLNLRGIDVKEIDIKVSPPARSGDGPSVTVGDRQQDSADVWQQDHQDDFSQSNYDAERPGRGGLGGEDSLLLSEGFSESSPPGMDRGAVSGSLHITA